MFGLPQGLSRGVTFWTQGTLIPGTGLSGVRLSILGHTPKTVLFPGIAYVSGSRGTDVFSNGLRESGFTRMN